LAGSLLVAAGSPVSAQSLADQQAAAAAQTPAEEPSVQLKVTVVISRYDGTRQKSSLPYTLFVVSGAPSPAQLRTGAQVPVPNSVVGKDGAFVSYSYQSVGTNIDCRVATRPDGRLQLSITVTDNSLSEAPSLGAPADLPKALPVMKSFTNSSLLVLRDGETLQYTTAADRLNGETTRVDVTVNVVK
jgi:hypothetical protein